MPTYTQPEAIIGNALDSVLSGLVSYAAAWPNVKADPVPLDDYYMEIYDLRNNTGRPFISKASKALYQGIYQITLSAPASTGVIELFEKAGEIASGFFNAGPIQVTGGHITILSRPSVITMKSQNGARWESPISVNWRAYL